MRAPVPAQRISLSRLVPHTVCVCVHQLVGDCGGAWPFWLKGQRPGKRTYRARMVAERGGIVASRVHLNSVCDDILILPTAISRPGRESTAARNDCDGPIEPVVGEPTRPEDYRHTVGSERLRGKSGVTIRYGGQDLRHHADHGK